MAIYYSQGSGLWSTLANWDTNAGGGGTDPASVPDMDDDSFIVQAGHNIEVDVDMSAFANGIGLQINGGVTPGMVFSSYSGAGTYYLKIKTGLTLAGTTSTNRGRLLANSDGVWGNSGTLPFDRKFIIELAGTAYINALNLDIQLYDAEPTYLSVSTYKDIKTVSSINTGTDIITMTAPHGWAATTAVCIRSSGTLPAPLVADRVYYVLAPSGADLQLAVVSAGSAINITSAGSGTIEIYSGHDNTATGVMNVLTDVTADPQWVATAAVVLVDSNAPETYDQRRTTLSAVAAGTITLSVNVNSAQYPGARIWLVQRNIAIRSNTTTTTSLVNWGAATFAGSVLRCEIRSTAGTGTTFYGYGINAGVGHTISGTVSGCTYGVNVGTGHTISGTVTGCANGVNVGTGHTISGTVTGCSYGVANGTGHIISGTVTGCSYGVANGAGHIISGTVTGCAYGVYAGTGHIISGTVTGCSYGFRFDRDYGLTVICRAADVGNPPTFYGRNTTGWDPLAYVACEDYLASLGENWTFWMFGDTIRETGTVRPGGATTSIKAVPQSNCSTTYKNYLPIFDWTEFNVPASEQTRSIYILGTNWGVFPTAAELYFEAEYYSGVTGCAKSTVTSTAVLVDNTTWTQFSVTIPAHTQVGLVRYRAYLKKYTATAFVNVDNALY